MSCLDNQKPWRPLRRPQPAGPTRGSSSHQLHELLVEQTAPPSDLHASTVPCLCCEQPAKTRGPGMQRRWSGAVAELLREQTAPPLDLLAATLPNLSCYDDQQRWMPDLEPPAVCEQPPGRSAPGRQPSR